MIKTPLRYPGGKSRAIKNIAPLIPEFIEYREPFLGGASLFIYLKQHYPNKKFWLNDINKNLYLFWLKSQNSHDLLINQINKWREEFIDGKKLFQFLKDNMDSFNEIQKAAAFFVLNRITFSGTSESGGYSNSAFKNRFTISSLERVIIVSELLHDVKITNKDYQSIVETDGLNVFLFLDPPYYSAAKSALYGKNGDLHKSFDHERFAKVMRECQHKWLITYDDSEYIRDLFSFANIKEWNLKYGMRNVNKKNTQNGNELFIFNYDIEDIHHRQLSIFESKK